MFLVGWICELKSWNLWKIFEEHLVISAVVAVGCCFKTPNKKPFLHLLAIFFLAYTPPNKTCHWKIDRWKRRVLFDTVPSTQPQAAKPSRPSRAAFLREVQVAGNLGVATNFCRLGLRMRLIFFFLRDQWFLLPHFFWDQVMLLVILRYIPSIVHCLAWGFRMTSVFLLLGKKEATVVEVGCLVTGGWGWLNDSEGIPEYKEGYVIYRDSSTNPNEQVLSGWKFKT